MQIKIDLYPEMSFGLARTYINRIDATILHSEKREFMTRNDDGTLALVCEHNRASAIISAMIADGILED